MRHRCLLGFVLAWAVAMPAAADMLLISASNVRLRGAAGTDGPVIGVLQLGSELETIGVEDAEGWVAVRVPGEGGKQGWVNASLTMPVSRDTWPLVVTQLIAARSARTDDNFQAWRELLDLIESVQQRPWDPEAAAGLELQRLNALRNALIGSSRPPESRDPEVLAWRQARAAQARYNEPGGHWLIRNEVVRAAHDAHRGTKAADEIAWFAVQNGLAGECEGYIVCYLRWTDQLQGEYLRRQPEGRHVEAAAQRILHFSRGFVTDDMPNGYYFDPAQECTDMLALTSALGQAIRNSRAPQRAEVSARLAEMAAPCR